MNTKIYWVYAKRDELLALGVDPTTIHENIDYCRLTQCELTQEQCEKLIPKGEYCYDDQRDCPFHDIIPTFPKQSNGHCHYLKTGDYGEHFGLLWDSCKECNINSNIEELL